MRRIDIWADAHDVQEYLKFEIAMSTRLSTFSAKDPNLKDEIVKIVSEKAEGM